jgi:CheY-like chemotaxis protein/anti-sigma regulatory factor (Ser/Thr protein kinase)
MQALEYERKVNEAMELSTKSKNEFLATVSHELRTPLTSIIGFSEVIIDKRMITSNGNEFISRILREGKHLLSIVDDVLNLSLIDNDKMHFEHEIVHTSDIQQQLELKHLFSAQQKGVRYQIHNSFDMPQSFITDNDKLMQALNQLIDNAVKFTNEGSINLSMDKVDDYLQFTVVDTGIGMIKEQADHIFEPFTQGDSSNQRQYGGTGVGLYIAKMITEKMGGNLTVESEEGKGSKFCMRIPHIEQLTEDEDSELHALSRTGAASYIPKLRGNVLYAEDNEDNRRLLEVLCEPIGVNLVFAKNGKEAADLIMDTNNSFDLILMDIQMPIMSGIEAAEILRQGSLSVPIIAFSASAMDETQHEYEGLFDGYLPKPIVRSKLYELFQAYLDTQLTSEVAYATFRESGSHKHVQGDVSDQNSSFNKPPSSK